LPSPYLAELLEEELLKTAHESSGPVVPVKSFSLVKNKKEEFVKYIGTQLGVRPLSASGLNAYVECPWNFVIGHLLRIPQEPSFALQFGSAMHGVAEYVVEGWLKNKANPADEDIKKVFASQLYKQNMFPQDEQRAQKRGSCIFDWMTWSQKHWHQQMQVEQFVRAPFVQVGSQSISIHGKLDRIENLPNGSLRVLDYKTGKHKTRNYMTGNTKTSHGSQFRQLVFYKYLVEESKPGFTEVSEGVIEFLEPNDKGVFRREIFEFEPDSVRNMQDEIQGLYTNIQSGDFLQTDPKHKDCRYPDIASSIVRGLC
jgi:hypothetical protein